MKSYGVVILLLCVYNTIFCVGCWEANLALHHEPNETSPPGVIHGYIYTIFACVTNMIAGITLMCMLGLGDTKEKEVSFLYLPFVMATWSIVLFAGMVDHEIRTGPFQPVVVAQFAITMVISFLCCCSCGREVLSSDPPEIQV